MSVVRVSPSQRRQCSGHHPGVVTWDTFSEPVLVSLEVDSLFKGGREAEEFLTLDRRRRSFPSQTAVLQESWRGFERGFPGLKCLGTLKTMMSLYDLNSNCRFMVAETGSVNESCRLVE